MDSNKKNDDEFLISFSDIITFFQKFRLKIFFFSGLLSCFALIYGLNRPIQYEAEATFREKGIASNPISSTSVVQLLGATDNSAESEAASLMTSRKILQSIIEKQHMQGTLTSKSNQETWRKLMTTNAGLYWQQIVSPRFLQLPEICCPLRFGSLHYSGELPVSLKIRLKNQEDFEVWTPGFFSKKIGDGKLGIPFVYEKLSFVLVPDTHSGLPLEPQQLSASFEPMANVVKNILKILKVEMSKTDKSLLKIQFLNRDRHLASQFINDIMTAYQQFIKQYHEGIATQQLDYLGKRRDQLRTNLTNAMNNHANFLSQDLFSAGFVETQKDIDFLAKSLHQYKQVLLDNELEIKRLLSVKPQNLVFYKKSGTHETNATGIDAIFAEIRHLKQQRDALEIDMHHQFSNKKQLAKDYFDQQLEELQKIRHQLADVRSLRIHLQENSELSAAFSLHDESRVMLSHWMDRMQQAKTESEPLQEITSNFQFYLVNVERLLELQERILQERLVHEQNQSDEYRGINLKTAQEMYLLFSKEMVELEKNIRNNFFFIQQIEDPKFEITSLSGGLEDRVSNDIIAKASHLILKLHDENNQSQREQDRIKEELQLQKSFLLIHLNQMIQLMELNKQLISEKLYALQSISLALVQQAISLHEKSVKEYIDTHLENLQQERVLIKKQMDGVQEQMKHLPQKWVSEQILKQEIQSNQLNVEEIVKLVESTNIAHNLEFIQSEPLDYAVASIQPLVPNLLYYGLLGSFAGAVISAGFYFFVFLRKREEL